MEERGRAAVAFSARLFGWIRGAQAHPSEGPVYADPGKEVAPNVVLKLGHGRHVQGSLAM